MIDICAMVPVLAVFYVIVVSPLLGVAFPSASAVGTSYAARLQSVMVPRPENKIFWPALIAISVVLAARNQARFAKLA